MDPRLIKAYRFFREWAGGVVGESAAIAIRLARAELRADEYNIECRWEDEVDPWDGDCPAPEHCLCSVVEFQGHVASLGMVGVNSLRDPCLRVVAAELYAEVLEEVGDDQAAELGARATFAGFPGAWGAP